jgi:long-chain fatty acid transport protein
MLTLSRRRALVCAFVSGLALAAAPSQGAGFAIFEQGARGMGFAGAFTAQANDPSAIFHNAAGIAFLKGKRIYLGGTVIAPTADFTGADPFPGAVTEKGNAGIIVPPAFDYTQQLSERMVVGIGLHVPFGLKTQWQDAETYSGRFISKRAELKGFSVNPTLAYKLADRLSVGGGVDIRFSSVALDRNLAAINPFTFRVVDVASVSLKSKTKTGIGFNLGILAKPSDALSIGVSYRHKVKTDYTGDATFTRLSTGNGQLDTLVAQRVPAGAIPVSTGVEFPAILSGGIAYKWNDWVAEGDVNWYQWSTFGNLPLTFQGRDDLSGVIPEDYKNTLQYRFGLERRLNESWTVRGGYFYDQSPTPAESVGPLLPDADRHGACAGFSWKRGAFQVDVANWYLFFKQRSTEGLNRDNYNGTYKNRAELFAVSIGYGF